jgi:hypothetical protein
MNPYKEQTRAFEATKWYATQKHQKLLYIKA